MSLTDDFATSTGCYGNNAATPPTPAVTPKPPLHRIAEVRRQQGVSLRSIVRKTGLTPEQVKRQETPEEDLRLSELFNWQRALDVPVADLLVDRDAALSSPILHRARMLRAMKTVRAIKEANRDASIGRFVAMLENQLLEIMPELEDVSAWHTVGQRRTQDEVGRVAERTVSDSFVRDGLQ